MTKQRKTITSLRRFAHDYQYIHLALGLIGNAAFVIGSVFFLWDSMKRPAIWLFIVGSSGMLMGSIGSAIVKLDDHLSHSRARPDGRSNHTARRS